MLSFGSVISAGLFGTRSTTICWKKVRFDHKKTAFELRWEVARNSPDGAKSIDKGACWNLTQSMSDPVMISHTRMHLSIELHNNHFESGCEKHMSVIWLEAAPSNFLTFFSPVFTLRRVIDRSEQETATRSLERL